MASQDDFFTPEEVDEQLEAIERTGHANTQDLHLIESLSSLLAEQQVPMAHPDETHERILARVLSRLLSVEEKLRATEDEQPPASPGRSMRENGRYVVLSTTNTNDGQPTILSLEKGRKKHNLITPGEDEEQWNEQYLMKHSLKQSDLSEAFMQVTNSGTVRTEPRSRGIRLLGVLAAALVCITLVGSLALALNAMSSKAPTPPVGTQNAASCSNQLDPAEQTLCMTGQETPLDLPLTIRNQNITVVRAYADPQRVILIYSSAKPLDQRINWMLFGLPQVRLMGAFQGAMHINTTLYELSFMPDSPPLMNTSLQVQSIEEYVPQVTSDPDSGQTLQFTLPIHTAQRVVTLNQTQTSNGIKLTLQQVTFTGSTTCLSIAISPLESYEILSPLSFTLNGQRFTWPTYQQWVTPRVDGNPDQRLIVFDQINSLPSGSNTIQIQAGVSTPGAMTPTTSALPVYTWNFQVTIPA